MKNFEFFSPTHYVFGRGAENKAGDELKKLGGTYALIHYGGGSAVRSGLIDRVKRSLDEAGVKYEVLGGAQPNPRAALVYNGIELCREKGIDCLLAVGGGSAIDSCKAIATGLKYDGDFWDMFAGKAKVPGAMPFGVVLTMAAAGSEGSNSCVITNEDGMLKRSTSSDFNRPRFALMNPELTETLGAYQTACGVADMMSHVFERYFTNVPDVSLTDRLCEAVLSSIVEAAPRALANPRDYEARATLMWSSTLAHNDTCGLGRESDGASHKLAHELSALYDTAHGATMGLIFPAYMRFLLKKGDADMRLARLAVNVWGCQMDYEHPDRTALEGICRYENFLKSLGLPRDFAAIGARREDIPALIAKVRRRADGLVGNFRPLDDDDMRAIYEIAAGE